MQQGLLIRSHHDFSKSFVTHSGGHLSKKPQRRVPQIEKVVGRYRLLLFEPHDTQKMDVMKKALTTLRMKDRLGNARQSYDALKEVHFQARRLPAR